MASPLPHRNGYTTLVSGFPTKLAAEACVARLNHRVHTNRPTTGPAKVTLGEWVATWFTALDLDPRTGTLHESGHSRWLGAPKTASSARVITLPPFLIGLLRQHLQQHNNEFVFTTQSGKWLSRSTFIRRVLRPRGQQQRNRATAPEPQTGHHNTIKSRSTTKYKDPPDQQQQLVQTGFAGEWT
ncbi:hypothetical protein [Kibdelosporangium aridum]|uniref:hypothetical protein n=1 Tax=Kibdelosporangium aridum TaxID=2030 RepID=UPI0005251F00